MADLPRVHFCLPKSQVVTINPGDSSLVPDADPGNPEPRMNRMQTELVWLDSHIISLVGVRHA